MKFEESSLIEYLKNKLRPLTPADPLILAEYVATLLKKDKPSEELQKLCTDNLVDFLGHSAQHFVSNLFHALEDGSIGRPIFNSNDIKKLETSSPPAAVGQVEPESFSSKELNSSKSEKEEDKSTPSGPGNDPGDQDVSDDDDDRNHKHRKRENHPQAFSKDDQDQLMRRPNKRRIMNYGNGQRFHGNHSFGDAKRDNNSSFERDSSKFEKRHSAMTTLPRAPMDFGPRARINHLVRNDLGIRLDPCASLARLPCGKGRGRPHGPWNQHESKFSSFGPLDFSHMASQGSALPNMFLGTGLPSATNTQNPAWGAFGFIPTVPNGCLDPLNPLGLPGTVHSSLNSQINLNMPRQRCRDFEEQGFCLRGDMCPMEHGVNRIVVEDVQSLSQFNLPVSLASTCTVGFQRGSGSLPPVNSSSTPLTNSKSAPTKNNKAGVTDDDLDSNRQICPTAGCESDVYDPDQPLWNNAQPETSNLMLGLPTKVGNTGPSWESDNPIHAFTPSDCINSDLPSSSKAGKFSSHGRGQTSSGQKLKISRTDNSASALGYHGDDTKRDLDQAASGISDHETYASTLDFFPKSSVASAHGFSKEIKHTAPRTSQRASCTLFVRGIPQNSNKKEALLSHFEKFGEVIDIYIPMNSEKAFVQFSKREEAEAALRAPDAVMGNRFIKLFWALRDNVAAEKDRCTVPPSASVQVRPPVTTTPKVSDGHGEKESFLFPTPKPSCASATDPCNQPKLLTANTSKAATVTQKKRESLEILKEEIRRKQEMLDQKRNDFRNQLDKLAKQAVISKKGEGVSQQCASGHKMEITAAVPKMSNLSPVISINARPAAEKIADNGSFLSAKSESPLQPHPKDSPKVHDVSSPSLNRFKLDNRPTSFRVLSPLPAELANVATLKEHFSTFDDLCVVELEGSDANSCNGCQNSCTEFSACVTFTTRRSAERAFLSGRCWQSRILQFTWLTASSRSGNDCFSEQPVSSKRISSSDAGSAHIIPESYLSNEKICSTVKAETVDHTDNNGHGHIEGENCVHDLLTVAQSSHVLPSPVSATSMDTTDAALAQ